MANFDIIKFWGTVKGLLPAKLTEGADAAARTSSYGDLMAMPFGMSRHNFAREGTYFLAHNITNDASTTLAGHAAPVLVDCDATMTKAFIHLINPSSAVKCELDFIEIEVITAGANGTADSWACQLDTGATRIASGAFEVLTRVNSNMSSTNTALTVASAGPVTVGAESGNVRNLGFGQFRPSIAIAGDKYTFVCGGDPSMTGSTSIATIAHHVVALPPVVLGQADQFLLGLYSPSQSAAGIYKVRMGWVER